MRTAIFALLMFTGLVLAMTPDDFNSRLENYKILNTKNIYVSALLPENLGDLHENYAPPAQDNTKYNEWLALIEKTKKDYRDGYNAKESGDLAGAEAYFQTVMDDFEKLKMYTGPDLNMEPLTNVIKVEFGKPTPTIGNVFVIENKINAPAPEPTVIVVWKATPSAGRVIPTVSPDQLNGKKNIVSALMEILWENGLIIGAFFVIVLIIYGLYHKDDEESNFG